MMATGCIQSQRCHTNHCPVGVATQDPYRARALDVADKSERVYRYQRATVAQAMRMMASMGVSDPSMLNPHMLRKRVSPTEQRSYAEIYEWLEPGELLNHAPPTWRSDWEVADPDSFAPIGQRAQRRQARLGDTDFMPQVPPARYLLRAKDFVDARYAEEISVEDLAAVAGLSRAHFSRMFTKTFGESPHAYLQSRRLERAAALLRYTDRSVAEICVMVGLQSIGSFTTSFARVFGKPPAAYRASMPPAAVHARVPSCILRRDTRPVPDSRVKTAHGEKTG